MSRGLCLVGLSVTLAAACASPGTEVGSRSASVGYGTASTETRAVFVTHGGGGACAGSIVGPRHVLLMSFCATDPVQVFVGTRAPGFHDSMHEAIELRRGPDSSLIGGGDPTAPVIAIVDPPFDQSPLAIAEAGPAVDDELLLVGYGAPLGMNDGELTEGAIRVTAVATDNFTSEGIGDVRHCLDGTILDSDGSLIGFAASGVGGGEGCYVSSTNLTLSVWRDWIAETVAATPPPDAGPAEDAGPTDDGGMVVTDASVSVDAGAEPPADDDGCGCATPGSSHGGGGLLALGLVGLLVRRRRR